ncbi:MAG: class I SAM-dependent methyltransferase [Clostridiaceae bacterium]
MKFYDELAEVYDIVFPLSEDTLGYLKEGVEEKSEILDLACGTGEYPIKLSNKFNLKALDLDKKMIDLAGLKKGSQAVDFKAIDMRTIKNIFEEDLFDEIYCIGNSLVHLENKKQVEELLKDCFSLLKKHGLIKIQIINFDRIYKNNIKYLPTIKREKGISLKRNYAYEDEKQVDFITKLTVNDKEYENTVKLMPLFKADLEEILKKAKFSNIKFYGDFKKSLWNDESYALIVEASK